jgi:hypothetical protein
MQTGDYWQTLSNDQTLSDYSKLLHHWTHAVLASLEPDHPSDYQFPVTEQDRTNAAALKDLLKSGSEEGGIQVFHNFIKPILYAKARPDNDDDYSKWNEVFECQLALGALRNDGNFKHAHAVTGTFATIFYHIRGCILYEGIMNKANFGGNAYK